MYFVKVGELCYLRFPGMGKSAKSSGLLSLKNIQKFRKGTKYTSQNPLLRGIPATSARQAPPLVVTMGTTGV